MKGWALQAKSWGADVTLKAYTDERVANEDFKASKCNGVSITAMRAREYNKFVGSIDSIGAIPSNKVAQSAISFALNSRNAAKMVSANKKYEVVGIAPLGSAYLFVNDRNIKYLTALKQLTSLRLFGTSVSLNGLAQLKDLPLRQIVLPQRDYEPAQLDSLRKVFPHTKLIAKERGNLKGNDEAIFAPLH